MYTTQRGTETETIPFGQLTMDQRVEILQYYVAHGRRAAKQKYKLSNQTIGHLIYHYKDMIEEIEDDNFAKAGL